MGDNIRGNKDNQCGNMGYPNNYKEEYKSTHPERAMIHARGYLQYHYSYTKIKRLITTLLQRADCSGNKKNDRGKKHSANGLLQCHFMLHRYQC